MKRTVVRGLTLVFALLFTLSLCLSFLGQEYHGFVNEFFNVRGDGTGSSASGEYLYKTAYTEDGKPSDEGMKKLLEAEDAFNQRAEEESAVLVYNNGALPLGEDVKNISLLGRAVVDPVYRNGGAGPTLDTERVIGLEKAMKDAGFNLNQKLLDAYNASGVKRETASTKSIGEVDVSFYTDELQSTFASYGDAAVIMFSRYGGEGSDLMFTDADGENQLALHKQEADLLRLVKRYKDSGAIKKVIVLINSVYPMELDWIFDEQYGVDACMSVGNPGLTGFAAIPALLKGEVNPSGHFTDTYAADSLSAPAVRNMGDTMFSNQKLSYAVFAENIYVGYKYYETRYEDCILGRFSADSTKGAYASGGAWNYADEITFPFGYGLSYSTFTQKLESVTWNSDNTITVEVSVTNNGPEKGRSVVQVYAQTPYTAYDQAHGVEKSAIQLLDFAKTDLLDVGETEKVTIVADKYLLESWDSTAHNGEGGYILDDGDYYIAIGDNAHDALNNVLAAKGASGMFDQDGNPVPGDPGKASKETVAAFDDTTYQYSKYSGNPVDNKFDTDLYATDYNHSYPGTVTYLTRQDWNTYPDTVAGLTMSDEMLKIHNGDFYEEVKTLAGDPAPVTVEQDKGIQLADMHGVAWDDPKWDEFLNQLSVSEMSVIVSDSYGQKAVKKINKPANAQGDGPDGASKTYAYGDKGYNTTYVNEATMACSWSKEIMRLRGEFFGEDGLYNRTNLLMAPGVDIHRTPFSGRNCEYFSEDGVISYIMGAVVCKAMQEKGIVAMTKHIAANDMETNRGGLCSFMTEQGLREISLKGFEGCLTVGGAMSTMEGLNCLGVVNCARNRALMTDVLRSEWDWKGFSNTDAKTCTDTPELCILSGTDEFCMTNDIHVTVAKAVNAGDKHLLAALRETNKRYYYTYANSNLVNGLSSDTVVTETSAWWETGLMALDIAFGCLTAASCALYVVMTAMNKNKLWGRGKQ